MLIIIYCTMVLGIIFSLVSLVKHHKTLAFILLVFSVLLTRLSLDFCSKKTLFVFGGSDFEFLIQRAFVDKSFEAWIIIAVFLLLIIAIFACTYILIKERKYKVKSISKSSSK